MPSCINRVYVDKGGNLPLPERRMLLLPAEGGRRQEGEASWKTAFLVCMHERNRFMYEGIGPGRQLMHAPKGIKRMLILFKFFAGRFPLGGTK